MSHGRHFAAGRRRSGVDLAAQPEVIRLLSDLTFGVFAAGVLCAAFTWLDQSTSAGADRGELVMELAAELGTPIVGPAAAAASGAWPDDPEVAAAIVEVWGTRADEAAQVAFCESSFRTDVVSENGEDWGLFQVNVVHRPFVRSLGYAWNDLLDPRINSAVAAHIYERAGGWSPWTCEWAATP
jgi:hypothetical protein